MNAPAENRTRTSPLKTGEGPTGESTDGERKTGAPADTIGTTEVGSALALFVAAFLSVLVLTGICIDTAMVFLGHREIANAANAAANDAVSGIDLDSYYGSGRYDVAETRAAGLASASWQLTSHDQVRDLNVSPPRVLGPTRVEVTASGKVPLLFARSFPFLPSAVTVRVRVVAEAHTDAP